MTVLRSKYMKKFRKKTEYKYAFGQRIPVDYEWRVKQRQAIEQSNKKKCVNQNKKEVPTDIQYDYNGRRINK